MFAAGVCGDPFQGTSSSFITAPSPIQGNVQDIMPAGQAHMVTLRSNNK
jgi:hypothetical protein